MYVLIYFILIIIKLYNNHSTTVFAIWANEYKYAYLKILLKLKYKLILIADIVKKDFCCFMIILL